MSNEDMKKKIQESLQKAGVTTDQLELAKGVKIGNPEALYKKACGLLGRIDCKAYRNNAGDNSNYWEWEYVHRMIDQGLGEKIKDPFGEWFQLLEKAAKGGNPAAIEDILELCEFFPYNQKPKIYLYWTAFAANDPQYTYVDNEGIRQPYALRLADIYFKGRIHTDDRRDSILGDDHYDGVKNWGNDEGGKNIYVRTFGNVIGQNLKKALKYYTIAAENNSSKGMIKLQFLYRVKAIMTGLGFSSQ